MIGALQHTVYTLFLQSRKSFWFTTHDVGVIDNNHRGTVVEGAAGEHRTRLVGCDKAAPPTRCGMLRITHGR